MRFWPLGMFCSAGAPLDQRAGDAAQPQIDREPDADRTAADDDDLISFCHHPPRSNHCAAHHSGNTIAPRKHGEDPCGKILARLRLVTLASAVGLAAPAWADKATARCGSPRPSRSRTSAITTTRRPTRCSNPRRSTTISSPMTWAWPVRAAARQRLERVDPTDARIRFARRCRMAGRQALHRRRCRLDAQLALRSQDRAALQGELVLDRQGRGVRAYKLRVIAKEPTPYDLMRFAYVTAILPQHQAGDAAGKRLSPDRHRALSRGPGRRYQGHRARAQSAYRHGNPAKQGAPIERITIRPVRRRARGSLIFSPAIST